MFFYQQEMKPRGVILDLVDHNQKIVCNLNQVKRPTSKKCLFPVRCRVGFFSKWADWYTLIVSFLSEQLQINVKYDFKTVCFRFIRFTFIWIRLLALIFSPCYKYATLIKCASMICRRQGSSLWNGGKFETRINNK